MSKLLDQCLLLALSDVSDEEQSDTSDESDIEHILLQLATEFVAAEEKSNKTIGEKRIARYSDVQFVHNLSITKQLAQSLSAKFEKSWHYQNVKYRGRQSLSAQNQFHVFLWFATHQNVCYRHVSRYFGISLSTVHATLYRIGLFLCEFVPEIIKWPDQEERLLSADNYCKKTGISGIVGCLGTFYIKTNQLIKYESSGSQCVVLPVQVVCNDENKFIDISIGNEDADNPILINADLLEKLDQFREDEYLVGDNSLPGLHNHIIVPTSNCTNMDANQELYNQNLNFCIEQMDMCFTALKARFRSLNCLKVRNTTLQHLLIKSCFVLYNLNYNAQLNVNDEHNYTSVSDHSNANEVHLNMENKQLTI